MKRGLIIGKFYPLHVGHLGLIKFAQSRCDELLILICVSDKESISGEIRKKWISESFLSSLKLNPVIVNYNESDLPNTSISSTEVSKIWASYIKKNFDPFDFVFSSEPYGYFLAEELNCVHVEYDIGRINENISASRIRENPFVNWDYISDSAKPFYVKKICLYGTESTGKSTLAERLATYYETVFVPEMAREIIETTKKVEEKHLHQIAELHARRINDSIRKANKLLFVDTDVNITKSYSKFLFNKELNVDEWVDKANKFDLYLFLDKDAQYIQDGTRLNKTQRDILNDFHKKELENRNIPYELISGNWNERLSKSIEIINRMFF
ncbi:MAG: AAA family ATPase [Chitinophagales bacterium]